MDPHAPPRLFVLGSFVAACCAGVERLPRPGESLLAASFTLEPGGKGFNVAVAARRRGAAVDCMAAVGDDLFAGLAAPAFEAADLSAALLVRKPGCATGSGIGFVAADGENCLAVHPGANHRLSGADVAARAAVVTTAAACVAGFEAGDEAIATAFALARGAGRTTLLNPSPFRPIAPALLATTSILVANAGEAAALAAALGLALDADEPASVEHLAAALRGAGVAILVVTLGAAGSIAVHAGGMVRQPAFAVTAVDTLGAGDAYLAALAVDLIAGNPLPEAMRSAAAAGALTVRERGTFSALPTARAVRDLLSAAPPAVPHVPLPS